MRKIANCISYITLIAVFIFVCIVIYWSIYPYKPIVYQDKEYPILNENKEATQGGILKYQVNYCKYTTIVPLVLKRYVDGIMYDTPYSRGVVTIGCHSQVVDNLVPETLPPGKYHMDIVVDYKMNPIRNLIYNNKTEEFTIVAAK
jgi:hypothetical protein